VEVDEPGYKIRHLIHSLEVKLCPEETEPGLPAGAARGQAGAVAEGAAWAGEAEAGAGWGERRPASGQREAAFAPVAVTASPTK
jgi:hypothetical protein